MANIAFRATPDSGKSAGWRVSGTDPARRVDGGEPVRRMPTMPRRPAILEKTLAARSPRAVDRHQPDLCSAPTLRTVSEAFFRHHGIFRPDVSCLRFTPGACPALRSGRCQGIGHTGKKHALPIVRDEFRPAIPQGLLASRALSASPAPTAYHPLPGWPLETGTFYFAEKRKFLLCLDRA